MFPQKALSRPLDPHFARFARFARFTIRQIVLFRGNVRLLIHAPNCSIRFSSHSSDDPFRSSALAFLLCSHRRKLTGSRWIFNLKIAVPVSGSSRLICHPAIPRRAGGIQLSTKRCSRAIELLPRGTRQSAVSILHTHSLDAFGCVSADLHLEKRSKDPIDVAATFRLR